MENKTPTLILIRGLPGSGKSTLAKELIANGEHSVINHFEADMYFVKYGEYLFDPKQIGNAHKWCKDCVQMSLGEKKSVIVSNTFTKLWEMDVYLKMAKEIGATIKIIEAKGNYKNVHGVPQDKLDQMAARWEELSDELKPYLVKNV